MVKINVRNGSHYPICEIYFVRSNEKDPFPELSLALSLDDKAGSQYWLLKTDQTPLKGIDDSIGLGGFAQRRVPKGNYIGHVIFDVPDGPDIEVSRDLDLHQDYTWEVTH